ncbi:MAG: site-2 protease family protein, partial [Planctomycetota bacterium]|nr:site-2 protease family protein [Planctomycetota bacterium]
SLELLGPFAFASFFSQADESANADDGSSPQEVETRPSTGQHFDSTIGDTPRTWPVTSTSPTPHRIRRRTVLPLILFFATCLSTFWVGVTHWQPVLTLESLATTGGMDLVPIRRLILSYGEQGVIYMACVMAILLCHELGHFFVTLLYRVPASFPIFLPFPFNPIGTFGAVIGMHGMQADRRQIYDIGLAGPLAGLVIAVPVMVMGILTLDVSTPGSGDIQINCPLGTLWLIQWLRPDIDPQNGYLWLSHLNPYFVAGWVGFLITGLNMMPISQLDGGHVIYSLIGKKAHWVARITIVTAIAFMVYYLAPSLVLMTILLLLVGTDHPPTRNDRVPLGGFRIALGWLSLSIPFFCFPPFILRMI